MSTPIYIKWFPPSWIQIKAGDHIIYFDPAYLKTNFSHYPKRTKPKVIIPMHRFETDPEEYKKFVEKEAFIKVEVLDIGETYRL